MFDPKNLHHAYFIEGEKTASLAALEAFLKDELNIVRQGHPDVHFAEYDSLGIDESRDLQSSQSMKPLLGDRKIFIIITGAITSEAQNSLLKVFEEPTPGTHFFIISSSHRILLPTLRSRMVIVTHRADNKAAASVSDSAVALATSVRRFIKMSPKDRLAFVAPMIEEKDKAAVENFLSALVGELHGESLQKSTPAKAKNIKEILSLANYLKDRASSLKLILERISLLKL